MKAYLLVFVLTTSLVFVAAQADEVHLTDQPDEKTENTIQRMPTLVHEAVSASAISSSEPVKSPESAPLSGSITPDSVPPLKMESNTKNNYSTAQDLLLSALSLIGVKYKWGGNTPESGLDCSGFVRYVFQNSLKIALPRSALGMSKMGKNVEKGALQPGDLVFFNTLRRQFSHVGIYLGRNQFIHSPRKGKSIEVSDMNKAYWTTRYNGARRVSSTLSPSSAIDKLPTLSHKQEVNKKNRPSRNKNKIVVQTKARRMKPIVIVNVKKIGQKNNASGLSALTKTKNTEQVHKTVEKIRMNANKTRKMHPSQKSTLKRLNRHSLTIQNQPISKKKLVASPSKTKIKPKVMPKRKPRVSTTLPLVKR